ncbi:MAG: hypothetical protein VX824_07650, partial [Pseudomonadota bacterium]|nr:hypothetical protein [Pseudomonadota bacterium]
ADLLLTDVEINCKGTVDHRGLFGTADVTPHFQEVWVDISLKLVISEDQRQSFEQTCLNRCPVYNLIKDSGAPIKVNWNYQ